MDKMERFYFLNFINGAYRIAFAENAVNSQDYLSKLISFFRYYFNEPDKVVRLKEELKQIELFSEINKLMSGRQIDLNIDVLEEVKNIYLPVNSISRLIQDLTINTGEVEIENLSLGIKGFMKENNVFILISMNYIQNSDTLKVYISNLKDLLIKNLPDLADIGYAFDEDSNIEISIKILV